MKTLFFDCSMGAAGDMLAAALLDVFPEGERLIAALHIPEVEISVSDSVKSGVRGKSFSVKINGEHEESEHAHAHAHDIEHTIRSLDISEKAKKDALAIYGLITQAESEVHGVSVEQVHLHEVGALDAVADIVSVCVLMDAIAPDKINASPVCTGSGTVKCAHGMLPVPAPATEILLRGGPVFAGDIRTELCTPTGAALLRYFVSDFGQMPAMTLEKSGYGMGKKEFPERLNCVRAMLGSAAESGNAVTELRCNIDDMTPEALSFAAERLMELGALDVNMIPCVMKKGRSGFIFSCLCRPEDKEKYAQAIFKYTSTIGLREYNCPRRVLAREERTIETPFGTVGEKVSRGFGIERAKYEYEDLRAAAEKLDCSIAEAAARIDRERK